MRRRDFQRGGRGARSVWVYRALLQLYPPSLQREYGDEMLWLFRQTLRDEVARSGAPGMARAWATALRDLAVSLPREWPPELRHEWRRDQYRRAQRAASALRQSEMAPLLATPQSATLVGKRGGTGARTGMQEKFEKFTERARKVMSLAQEEAQRFNHSYIGTEHLLLGLVREGDGVAAKVLNNLGVELNKTRAAVEHIIGRGDRVMQGEIGLTPRAKKVVELAVDEARRLNHHYIGTEHLLLGLIREGEGIAAGVLESQGVNLESARAATLEVLLSAHTQNRSRRVFNWTSRARRPGAEDDSLLLTLAPPETLDHLSSQSAQALLFARDEALRLNHNEVGTGHLLLGLLRNEDTVAGRILRGEGVTLEQARRAISETLKPGKRPTRGAVGASARALWVMQLADEEARRRSDGVIETEHLLLGLIRESPGLSGGVLRTVGVDPEALGAETLKWLAAAQIQRAQGAWAAPQAGGGPALNQLTALCRDVAATQRFYEKHFGATVAFSGEAPTLRLPGGGALLALRSAPEGTPPVSEVSSVELDLWSGDVDLLWRTLKDAEVAGLSEISESLADVQSRVFTVPDPDGRLVRVHQVGGA